MADILIFGLIGIGIVTGIVMIVMGVKITLKG